jgi:hypothetical protein
MQLLLICDGCAKSTLSSPAYDGKIIGEFFFLGAHSLALTITTVAFVNTATNHHRCVNCTGTKSTCSPSKSRTAART